MQEDNAVWQNSLAQYKFKTIIFAHTDSTPWSKKFLSSILFDNNWALIYFDRYYVVLVNKVEYSEEFISEHIITEADFRNELRAAAQTDSLKGKFSLASLSQTYNQPDLAKEIYRHIIFANPNNDQALFSLGYLYSSSIRKDDLFKALYYFKRGLQVSPKMPGIYNQIGLVYWNMGDYVKAEEAWQKALRVNRCDSTAKYYLKQIEDLEKSGKLSL
jgi:tetratricopeptide (TPR) repeat protein